MTEAIATTTDSAPAGLTEWLQSQPEGAVTPDNIGQILDVYERCQASAAKGAFLAAMADFQNTAPALTKNAEVNFGQGRTAYKHATLGYIKDKIKPALHAHGLSYRFEPVREGDEQGIRCVVSHIGGHSECAEMYAPADTSGSKNQIQARGSTVTYLQRYTLLSALGLTVQGEDDDAEGATKELVTDAQASMLADMCASVGADASKALEFAGADDWQTVPADMFDELMQIFGRKKNAQK